MRVFASSPTSTDGVIADCEKIMPNYREVHAAVQEKLRQAVVLQERELDEREASRQEWLRKEKREQEESAARFQASQAQLRVQIRTQ